MTQIEEFKSIAKFYDDNDSLANYKNEFEESDNQIYFDGNSLGRLPKRTKDNLDTVINQEWEQRLIRSWDENWLNLGGLASQKLSKLLNVLNHEVCVADNTSTNLFKLAFGVLKLAKNRKIVLTDEYNFPTDQYILDGLCKNHFPEVKLKKFPKKKGDFAVSLEEIKAQLTEEVALLCLSHVLYKSAYVYDMKTINKWAEEKGIFVIWDLSHSAGAIPLNLKADGCKMAVGCTYKFINAGPGAAAFLYLDQDLIPQFDNPISGWFAHEKPFDFNPEFISINSINKFSTGTPAILSMAGISTGVDLLLEAGMVNLRYKSLSLSRFFITLFDQLLVSKGFVLESPMQEDLRASHVSISHPNASKIMDYLLHPKDSSFCFIPDFRPPNIIRIGLAPLYNTHTEVLALVLRLCECAS
jgi:kynureninase